MPTCPLKLIPVLGLSAVGLSLSAAPAPARPVASPNVVLILADDLGWGDPRCYNPASRIPTPNLDRLAAQGMRFWDAHTPASVCTPTRYALLTGRYAWRSRLKSGVLWGYSPPLIERGRLTLAELLQERGYQTAAIGKWHLGLGWPTRQAVNFGDASRPAADPGLVDYSRRLTSSPLDEGFGYFFGIPASLDMEPYLFVQNDRALELPTGRVDASAMRRRGGGGFWRAGPIAPGFTHEGVLPRLTTEAEAFLRGQTRRRPFFLYLALSAPHTPWMPTPEFRGRSGAGWYGDFVTQVDDTVGRVLRVLEERHLAKNTLVIFTSDNGAHWLPEDIEQFGHRANGPWRGQKSDWWEGGHRVPFIVRWPGRVQAGAASDALIGLHDVFATIADVLNVPLPRDAAEDSVSFLPVLRGQSPGVRQSIVHHSGNGGFAIRQGDWKLCLGLGSRGFSQPVNEKPSPGGPQGQLYNLRIDPGEQTNRWLDEPAVVARLTALLEKYRSEGRSVE